MQVNVFESGTKFGCEQYALLGSERCDRGHDRHAQGAGDRELRLPCDKARKEIPGASRELSVFWNGSVKPMGAWLLSQPSTRSCQRTRVEDIV